jgi:hypothetical protein
VGRIIERFHMGKHIELSITDNAFTWQRRHDVIAQEAALDGLYVIRTSVSAQHSTPRRRWPPTRACPTSNARSAR